jgi:hypothetical protein
LHIRKKRQINKQKSLYIATHAPYKRCDHTNLKLLIISTNKVAFLSLK